MVPFLDLVGRINKIKLNLVPANGRCPLGIAIESDDGDDGGVVL
jgi:hypothetical protein